MRLLWLKGGQSWESWRNKIRRWIWSSIFSQMSALLFQLRNTLLQSINSNRSLAITNLSIISNRNLCAWSLNPEKRKQTIPCSPQWGNLVILEIKMKSWPFTHRLKSTRKWLAKSNSIWNVVLSIWRKSFPASGTKESLLSRSQISCGSSEPPKSPKNDWKEPQYWTTSRKSAIIKT